MANIPYLDVFFWLFVVVLNLVTVILAWITYFRYRRLREPFEANQTAVFKLEMEKERLSAEIVKLQEKAAGLAAQTQEMDAPHLKDRPITS